MSGSDDEEGRKIARLRVLTTPLDVWEVVSLELRARHYEGRNWLVPVRDRAKLAEALPELQTPGTSIAVALARAQGNGDRLRWWHRLFATDWLAERLNSRREMSPVELESIRGLRSSNPPESFRQELAQLGTLQPLWARFFLRGPSVQDVLAQRWPKQEQQLGSSGLPCSAVLTDGAFAGLCMERGATLSQLAGASVELQPEMHIAAVSGAAVAAAAALRHPNIVAIHDVGEHEGEHYFSMDLITGHTLAEAVRDQPLPARRAAVYLKTIAEAVQYAHEHGVLHRDLKPSNVLIDKSDQPHITDFGLAKRFHETTDHGPGTRDLTFTGQVLGSPNFMSPEQAEGRPQAIGPSTDIYSLGALLYHLLTRQPPFQADTLTTLLMQVIETDPVAPRLLNPSIPRDLETICLKCLEKEPSRRYSTALALAADLRCYLESRPIRARPVGPVAKGWKWCRRRPALAGMTGAALVILILGLSGVLWQWRRASANERRATAGELFARQNAYAADMLLAQHALDDGNRGLALRLLEQNRPRAKPERDLRHWEWRYLWQRCQPDPCTRLQPKSTPSGPAFISQNGRVMAVRIGPANVELWDLSTKQQTGELPGFESRSILGLSPDGALLALRRGDAPMLEVWNLKNCRLASALDHPPVPTRSLAFSPDGRLLATFDHHSSNAVVRVIDWAAKRTLTNFTALPPRRGQSGVVRFSGDGHRLAIGEDYGRIRIVRWSNGSVVQIETQTDEGVTALAFSPDSKLLAAGFEYSSATIGFWDADSGEPCGQLTSPNGWVVSLAFSPDGQGLASANSDKIIRIWGLVDKTERRRFQGYQDVRNVSFLPGEGTLISGGEDGSVGLWEVDASSRPSNPAKIVISPDSGVNTA